MVSEGETMALVEESKTLIADNSEAGTIIQPINTENSEEINLEDGTAILPVNKTQTSDKEIDQKGTRFISEQDKADLSTVNSPATTNLTRVGAVLGTPIYMSPEQCRGESLTPRSDIYSLAVIVYQMLSGKLPFKGNYMEVMEGHKSETPPPLKAKKTPRKLKAIIMKALSKKPADRPVNAEAFASKMRANSEGFGALFRKSLVIYGENLPKILQLTVLTYLPLIIYTIIHYTFTILIAFEFIKTENAAAVEGIFSFLYFFLSTISAALFTGMMTWVIAQYLAYPLRPINLKSAFREVKKRAKSLSFTVIISTILSFIGLAFCLLPGYIMYSLFILIAPSIMMEGVRGKAAFKRSVQLTRRSLRTVFATSFFVFVIPILFGLFIGFVVGLANFAFVQSTRISDMKSEIQTMKKEGVKPQPDADVSETSTITINNNKVVINDKKKDEVTSEEDKKAIEEMAERIKRFNAIVQAVSQIFILIMIIFLASITSVITAMLYFKTRQAGGESMNELLGKLDAADETQSKWQRRVRARLIQSGRISNTQDTGG